MGKHKRRVPLAVQSFSLLLAALLLGTAVQARPADPFQDALDLFEQGLKTTETVNQELLKLTALSQSEQNRIGRQLLAGQRKQETLTEIKDPRWQRALQRLLKQVKYRQLE